jgi:hypothetical protein
MRAPWTFHENKFVGVYDDTTLIGVLMVSILSLSDILIFDFGIVPPV